MKYSATTSAFYDPNLGYPAGIPADAIDVTADEFTQAITARATGGSLSVVNGALVVTPYAGPTLADAQATQIGVLNTSYAGAIVAPVSFTTAGGATASFTQSTDAKRYLAQCIDAGASAWTFNLWLSVDSGAVSPFTYADLQGLAAAMEAAEVPAYQDLLAKVADVNAATTVAAVKAISF